MSTNDDVKVPFFKKGKSRPNGLRKRSLSPSSDPVTSSRQSEVIHRTPRSTGNLLSASTKRTATQRQKDESDLGDADGDEPEIRDGPDVKWTAEGSHIRAAMEIIAGDEVEEMLAKRKRKEDGLENVESQPDDGLYRGQKAYRSHLKKDQEVPKAMRIGPQRSTNTIRTATIVDYQPDVCKDYKGV